MLASARHVSDSVFTTGPRADQLEDRRCRPSITCRATRTGEEDASISNATCPCTSPNGSWRAGYRDHEGRQHAGHFPTETAAQNWLDGIKDSLCTCDYVDPKLRKTTVDQWADQWIKGHAVNKESTVRQARTHLNYISARCGRRQLDTVKPSDVRAWVAQLQADGLAASYVQALHRRLSQLSDAARADGLIAKNPCSRRTAPPMGKQRPYVASTEHVWGLHAAMPTGYGNAVLSGAFAGLRLAEVAAPRASEVDGEAGVVHPRRQHPARELKTESSRTPVPVAVELAEMLRKGMDESMAGFLEDGHVVVSEWWRGPSPSRIQVHFRAAREKVPGLPEGFRFHDLRHCYASLLIGAGLDIRIVQAKKRHDWASTTLDVHGHMYPDIDESARAAVAGAPATRADSVRTQGRYGPESGYTP